MTLDTTPLPSSSAPRYEVDVLRDVRIPTAEPGVTLSADVYLPAGAGPVPALVMATPYRKDAAVGIEQEPHLRWFARRGYASAIFDFRGMGSSDGTMRRALDADEGDDGVSAVEWAATQPWCSGSVGMWGLSYGSTMSMRTAALGPAPLKAIIPIMGPLDPERDFVHPYGARGGQAPIPFWASSNLANQLLPPLHAFHDAEEQRRWRQRLHETEPWLLDLHRHGPGDPAWRERVVDAAAIETPSLCVAGWWDVMRDAQIRAYEQMRGPKKLLVGPWMHTMPQGSPFERIEFLSIALRWWDHWLRGVDDGLMDELPVTLHVNGGDPTWRAYASWPPADGELRLSTGADTTLGEPSADASATAIAEHRSDPTIGAQSGLWALVGQMFGLPLDQHEDDSRALTATSAPLADDVLIVGRPEVTVRLADGASPERLVVRLCEVDPNGRSTLIACGVAVGSQQVVLDPTAHRVRAGQRLRVAVGDADFPRLWPLVDAPTLHVAGVELRAPTAASDAGTAVCLPRCAEADPETTAIGLWAEPTWQVARHPVQDAVEVVTGTASAARTPGGEHLLELRQEIRASVRHDAPQAAAIASTHRQLARLSSGETIEVLVTTRLSDAALWVHGDVSIDGAAVFSRTWDAADTAGGHDG